MGTAIELKAGAVTLDHAKNHMGNDYGFLYQKGDVARRVSDQLDYEYCEENSEDISIADFEESFVRPLGRVLPRLDILGFTLESARAEYEGLLLESQRRRRSARLSDVRRILRPCLPPSPLRPQR